MSAKRTVTAANWFAHQFEPSDWTETATEECIDTQLDLGTNSGNAVLQPFPLAVKANIAVRGFRRSAACPIFDTAPEEADAAIVATLRHLGAVVVGTSNMHELAFGITSVNPAFGSVQLPGHPTYSAGGSSGGSAAVVARGDVPLALGTDTGGSISIPASHCGVVGFRPSTGRWPGAGILGLSTTRDTPGLFARSVREIETIDSLVTGETAAAATGSNTHTPKNAGNTALPRIGIPSQLISELHPATLSAFESARALAADHFELVEFDYGEVLAYTAEADAPTVLWEARRLLSDAAAQGLGTDPERAYRHLVAGVASEDVRGLLEETLSSPITPRAYATAQRCTAQARAAAARLREKTGFEALLFPATAAPAPSITAGATVEHLGKPEPVFKLYTRNTCQGTVLGAPMVTVPVPVGADRLPVGITLQGFRFSDRSTLALARSLEQALNPAGTGP